MTVLRCHVNLLFLRCLGLALAALTLSSCVASPGAPANAPQAAAPLPTGPSVISLPVSLDLEQAGADLLRQQSGPFLLDTRRRPLPIRSSSLRASIATEPGVCSVTALSCLARNSVRTVAADTLATAEAEVTQQLQLRELRLAMEGGRLQLNAEVDLSVTSRLRPEMAPLGPTACGEKSERARFELQQTSQVSWSPDGEVMLGPDSHRMRWLRSCDLSGFPGGVEAVLDLAGLRERLQDMVQKQVLNRLRQDSLHERLERAWPELNTPRELATGTWLLPQPGRVIFGDLVGKGRTITTTVLVQAHPQIVRGARPAVAMPPIPVPEHGPAGADGLRLAVRGDLALDDAARQMELRLGESLRLVHGEPVRLERVRVWGNGRRAVLGLVFGAPGLAELYLFAKPVYDLERNEVALSDLEFTPATRAYLARVATWMLAPGLLSALEAGARFRFDEGLAGAVREFRELRLAAGQGLTLSGGLQRVRPQALYFTRDRLVALLLLEGRLALEARQR